MSSTAAYPTVSPNDIGWLSEQQMIEVDRVMMEDLRIDLPRMMENAGRNLAQLVIDRFAPRRVAVLSGSGGNGGGGLVAARHLANRGVEVSVTLGKDPHSLTPVPAQQLDILNRMGVAVVQQPSPADVVVDALIGYSLKGAPRGRIGELIDMVPTLAANVVSLDTPSGLNVTDGSVPGSAVQASATLTLALPKLGLRSSPLVGELYVADISVPPAVYTNLTDAAGGPASPPPNFAADTIIRVVDE